MGNVDCNHNTPAKVESVSRVHHEAADDFPAISHIITPGLELLSAQAVTPQHQQQLNS